MPSTITLPPINVRSHWQSKQMGIEITVTRVNSREVSYIGVHGAICGTVPQLQFLQNFQLVTECKKKPR
jgi:hypothetical protein